MSLTERERERLKKEIRERAAREIAELDSSPHGEQQSQIDWLESRSDDAYDPADWNDYDNEFDPEDE